MKGKSKVPEVRTQSKLSKLIKTSLFAFLFIVVSIATYATSYVDYSFDHLTLLRILAMGLCYFYFYKLAEYVYTSLSIPAKNQTPAFYAFIVFFLHMLLLSIGTDYLNNWLINKSPCETIAMINNCHKSKGTEYCMYSYTIDHKSYTLKYCNEPANLRFRESDTVTIVYFSSFPVISKLKNELEQ